MAVNVAALAAGVAALTTARQHLARLMAGATAAQMALLLLYWRLMAQHYDEHGWAPRQTRYRRLRLGRPEPAVAVGDRAAARPNLTNRLPVTS